MWLSEFVVCCVSYDPRFLATEDRVGDGAGAVSVVLIGVSELRSDDDIGAGSTHSVVSIVDCVIGGGCGGGVDGVDGGVGVVDVSGMSGLGVGLF